MTGTVAFGAELDVEGRECVRRLGGGDSAGPVGSGQPRASSDSASNSAMVKMTGRRGADARL